MKPARSAIPPKNCLSFLPFGMKQDQWSPTEFLSPQDEASMHNEERISFLLLFCALLLILVKRDKATMEESITIVP